MRAAAALDQGNPAQLFRGGCDVLEQALLAQSCRLVLAAITLASHADTASSRPHPPAQVPHVWRARALDTTTTPSVDHVLCALGVRPEDVDEVSRSLQSAPSLPPHADSFSLRGEGSANADTAAALAENRVKARECLQRSSLCAVLTGLHMLLCSTHPYEHCRHTDGSLREAVRAHLGLESSDSTEKRAAARLLAEYALQRWRSAADAWPQDNDLPTGTLALVDMATRTDVFDDVLSSGTNTCADTVASHERAPAESDRRVLRVQVPPATTLVFPELTSPVPMDSTLTRRVDCGCTHAWFRRCVPHWLLEVCREEHARRWSHAQTQADVFRHWRRRRGRRILERLASAAQVDEDGDSVERLLSAAARHDQRHSRHHSECSSISGHSTTSVPSLSSQQNVVTSVPVPASSDSPLHDDSSRPIPMLASPTPRARTCSPLRHELIDRGDCGNQQSESGRELFSDSVHTPAREPTTLADGVGYTGGAVVPLSDSRVVDTTDDVDAASLFRTHTLRRVFLRWRDGRFYERLAEKYLGKRGDELSRRAAWERWRTRVCHRQTRQQHRRDNALCDVRCAQKQTALLHHVVDVWHAASLTRCFQWHHLGRRTFRRWQRVATLQNLQRFKQKRFDACEAPVLVAQCFTAWRSRWQQRVADRHCAVARLMSAWKQLRKRVEGSPFSATGQHLHHAQSLRVANRLFHTWCHKTEDRRLMQRYAQVRTLRVYQSVVTRWQRAARSREQARQFVETSTQRVLATCLRQWSAAAQTRREERTRQVESVQYRTLTLLQHWRRRASLREKMRRDTQEVAARVAPSLQARWVLRVWSGRARHRRAEKRTVAYDQLERTADARYRLHLVARSFFHWRANLFLSRRYAIDARRALPSAAVWPSQQHPVPLTAVAVNARLAVRSGLKRGLPGKEAREDEGTAPFSSSAAAAAVPRAASALPPRHPARTAVVPAGSSRLTAERQLLRVQHEVGQRHDKRARPATVSTGRLPSQKKDERVVVVDERPNTSPSRSTESAQIASLRPRTPSSTSFVAEVAARKSPTGDLGSRVTGVAAVPAPADAPAGLNTSHASPTRAWTAARHTARAHGVPSRSPSTQPRQARGTTACAVMRGSVSVRPRYAQPTVSSAAASLVAATPEKQVLRGHAFDDEGLPTPIVASQSLLATSLASEGLSTW